MENKNNNGNFDFSDNHGCIFCLGLSANDSQAEPLAQNAFGFDWEVAGSFACVCYSVGAWMYVCLALHISHGIELSGSENTLLSARSGTFSNGSAICGIPRVGYCEGRACKTSLLAVGDSAVDAVCSVRGCFTH